MVISNLLVAHHRKKIVTRTLENLSKTELKTEGTRIGKNYFLKYLLENPEMRRELLARNQPWQGTLSAESTLQTNPKANNDMTEETTGQGPALDETYVEMIAVLLSQVYSVFESSKQIEKVIQGHLLTDIVAKYQASFPKHLHSINTYDKIKEVLQLLRSENPEGNNLKYFDQLHLQRLLNFLLELQRKDSEEELRRKKKKIQTQSRVSRLIYIWKLVKEKQSISMIDITNLIGTELEKDMPYKIDKKTIVRLIDDLESISVATKKVFRIKIESQKILNDVTQFNRIMVTDSFVAIDDEQLKQDPCISNPTFKRKRQLPNSLDFLSANGQKPKLVIDQKPRLLTEIHEKALKQAENSFKSTKVLTQAEGLISLNRSAELREMRRSLTKLRCVLSLFRIGNACESSLTVPSVTDRFFQNKLEVTSDICYIADMLCHPLEGLQKDTKKKSMLDFDSVNVIKSKHFSSIDSYFEGEDKLLSQLEAEALQELTLQEPYASMGNENGTEHKNGEEQSRPSLLSLVSNCHNSTTRASANDRMSEERHDYASKYELGRELASVHQPELIYQRILQQLKKGHCTTKQELVTKCKVKVAAEYIIDQLILQGSIEEAPFVDAEGKKTTFLRSV